MATTVGLIKGATEVILGIGEVSIDNFTFKLFYKWSVSLFITGSVAVCSSQFFGDPIACETADDSVDEEVLNAYCWMYTTLDLPQDFKGSCSRKYFDSTNLYNTYYQWVSIFLMIQAIIFYIPRCIWLSMEGGLMTFLVKGNQGRVIEDPQEKQKVLLKNYLEHVHNKFNKYAFCFFFCELLNILISISQVFVTNAFLNYQFLDYGYLVYHHYRLPPEERQLETALNPMCEVFPKVGVCNYQRYGRGGGQETKNALCVLSLNMINDKVFAILWFWHCILIIAGVNRILTRSVQIFSSRIRFFLMKMMMHRYLSNNKHTKHIHHYIVHCSIGDWFVLYQMSKNTNKRFFAEFLALLSLKVNPDPDVSSDPEIDILKQIFENDDDEPSAPPSKFPDDTSLEFYDEEESIGSAESLNVESGKEEKDTRRRHLGKKDSVDKKLSKKHKGLIAHAGLKSLKKAK